MKCIHKLLPMLSLVLAAGGCVKEGDSNCIHENTTLVFKYSDTDGNESFTQNIHSVEAFIFDETNRLVVRKRFESRDLNEFAGWRLHLPAGDYYAVCWGNVEANSHLNDVTTFNEGIIEIPSHITATGDPIYYAPYKVHPYAHGGAQEAVFDSSMKNYRFRVAANVINVKEMFFVRAHRTINIYIMGYSGNQPATVTGMNLCAAYDFHYTSGGVFRNFTRPAQPVTTSMGSAHLATFHVGFSEVTEAMEFLIRQGVEGSILETINLKQFLADNPSAYQSTIDILVRFSDLGVTVSIPGWSGNPMQPGV